MRGGRGGGRKRGRKKREEENRERDGAQFKMLIVAGSAVNLNLLD